MKNEFNDEYNIRKLNMTDANRWHQLWQAYLHFYQTELSSKTNQHTFQRLIGDNQHLGCFVACDTNNTIIAFLTYIIHFSTWEILPICYLEDLFVEKPHRKKGVATLLIKHLSQYCKDVYPCSKLYWLTKPDNEVAKLFYNKIATSNHWLRYTKLLVRPD